MRGLILAAGRGSRMLELTGERPKCFVPLHGKILLEWQLEALKAAGVGPIAVGTGYRAESFAGRDVQTIHNARWAETNMVATLACAREWLAADTCIVSYSDIVYRPEIVQKLMAAPGDVTMTYDTDWLSQWSARFDDPLSDAETFKLNPDGTIREIGKKPTSLSEVEGQYMGLLRFTPAGWASIETFLATADVDRLDMTKLLNGLLAAGVAVTGVPISGGWFEVDSQRDLDVATRGWKA
ncbi:MAG: phosphocholine cytidylyltransferase family protein [Myxococcales bacterium]|nr:phosphocholine cytidylyltransferase family protein [Myxococcales bacterium]